MILLRIVHNHHDSRIIHHAQDGETQPSQSLFRDFAPYAKLREHIATNLQTFLCKVATILQDTLLQDIKKLNGFHHTGSLKVFHSLLLKYCPKRQHFSHDGMRARIELAILDHNYNTKRQ